MPKADTEYTTVHDTGRTRPDTITTPHRRGLLTGSIAALLAGTAAVATAKAAPPLPASGDDAELLALCAEFHEAHAAAYAVPTDDDEALHEAMGVRWEISDEIAEVPAATLAGHRAKAAVALVLLVENCRDEQSSADTDFALAALRDLAGSTVA